MHRLVLVVTLGACGGGSSNEIDCKALLADPGTTLSKLTEREADPAKVYDILERCLAPTGDTCERAAVDGAMAPSMAISDGSAGGADVRAAAWKAYAVQCRTLPPDQQRCLLVSYAIGHPDCGKVQDDFHRAHPPQ